jgi:dipeptidyl aminopeptidase/acylaminoacyl peptidase
VHLAAEDDRVRAVVAVSSFATMRRAVGDYERRYFPALAPWVPDSWLDDAVDDAAWLGAFDPDASPVSAAARVRAPLLLVHGGADTQVSPEHAAILEHAACSGARLVVLPGETHESVLLDRHGEVAKRALEHFTRRI